MGFLKYRKRLTRHHLMLGRDARVARLIGLALAIGAVQAVPAAQADILAAVDVPVVPAGAGCPSNWDIALINAATGQRGVLPAGINAGVDELHPSITPFGTRLTFQRIDRSGGTTRIIAADLGSGQQADLYTVFDAAQVQPNDPAFTPDDTQVITGAALEQGVSFQGSSPQFTPFEDLTSLSSFPGGPFSHVRHTNQASFTSAGATQDPIERSDGLLAVGATSGSTREILLDSPKFALKPLVDSSAELSYPAFSDPTTNVIVFQRRVLAFPLLFKLAFRSLSTLLGTNLAITDLPAIVNAPGSDVLHPSFTPDGRYLGFVRYDHFGDHHDRLFVFDTQTQTLLNSSGIDLGNLGTTGCGATALWFGSGGLSLRETFQLIHPPSLTLSGTSGLLSFQLAGSSGVGILVQRIVGHHRLFGHVVPTLKRIGRVPFGRFKRGRHHVRWNLRVNGRRLRPGTYLITPRLLTRDGVVHELGKPRHVRIR